jgi:uncharacterized protein (TIGR02271 family)
MVPYSKDKVKDAPRVETDDDGYLSPEEEDTLYRHYGRQYNAATSDGVARDDSMTGRGRTDGYDTSGPTTDDAMTRSEEEVKVGTTRRESGRARLRKYIVTEQVQTTVPVSHEEVRIEREPVSDANRNQAMTGSDLSEEQHEVVLHAEEPVVQKQVVPKERVRLTTDTVTEDAQISEDVRKEQIEQEGDAISNRTP